MTVSIKKTYIPSSLSKRDAQTQRHLILQSRKNYLKAKKHPPSRKSLNQLYQTRKKLSSFRSKPSVHVKTAKRFYDVTHIGATKELANKSGCTLKSLRQIIRKGEGAYFSSGSRPNQTPQSWAVARLASALTSGKAAAVDADILLSGCKPGSKGHKSAVNALNKRRRSK